MQELISIIFGILIIYLIIKFWLIILTVILSAYISFAVAASLPLYVESYKKFFKTKIKNGKIKEKTVIDFFNINQIMFKELFSQADVYDKLILFPGVVILSIFHSVITFCLYMPYRIGNFLFYSLIKILDDIYLKKHFVVCKNCYKKNQIPLYKCNHCHRIHKNLYPSLEFGVFNHICKCGNKLPVYKAKREKLLDVCPFCNNKLSSEYSILTYKNIITFIGNENVGKTACIIKILDLIIKNNPESKFVENEDKVKFDEEIDKLNKKLSLEKTSDIQLYNLLLDKNMLLYFFDVPGKMMSNIEKIINYDFFSYSSSLVLIINPIEIKYIKEKYSSGHNNYKPLMDTISRLSEILQKQLGLSDKDKFEIPLSIIINKTDVIKNINIKNNIEEQLIEWGEETFIQFLNVKFKNVQYYCFSCLEINDDKILEALTK